MRKLIEEFNYRNTDYAVEFDPHDADTPFVVLQEGDECGRYATLEEAATAIEEQEPTYYIPDEGDCA